MPGLSGLALTTKEAYEVLLARGWTEFDTVPNLTALAALTASNSKQVLVLDQSEIYTLDTASVATPDALRVIARAGGMPGRWLLFTPEFDLLWVCQAFLDLKLYAFSAAQASTCQSSAPHITITLPDTGPADGHAHRVSCFGFASNGDVWAGFADTNASPSHGQYVAKLSASKLVSTSSQVPDFAFPIAAFGVSTLTIATILFAPNGDMWVSTVASTSYPAGILKYTAASVAAPGTPSPAVVIHQAGAVNSANDLWFDPAGNLWYCNALAGTGYVNRLSADQLLSSDSAIVPDVVLSVGQYTGCTLDVQGNLWCAAVGVGRIDVFAASDIQASGAPTPIRQINTTLATGAAKVRFDAAGNLWAMGGPPKGYQSADIVASGSPAPSATLTGAGALTNPRVLNFNPQSFA